LQAEDFEQAGLNLEAVQNESDGWYSLDQMASRPIFYQMESPSSAPPPAPVPGYQSHAHYGVPNQVPLPEPAFAGTNVAGAYQSPYAPTMYATQQTHFQPTFQPGQMYAPGSVNNNFVQQPGTIYAPGYVENFVVQQPQPTTCTQPHRRQQASGSTYPVPYRNTEEWAEAQRRQPRFPSSEDADDGRGG